MSILYAVNLGDQILVGWNSEVDIHVHKSGNIFINTMGTGARMLFPQFQTRCQALKKHHLCVCHCNIHWLELLYISILLYDIK